MQIATACLKEMTGISSPALRYARKLQALLGTGEINELMAEGIPETCTTIRTLCEQIDSALYQTYIGLEIA